MARVTVEDCLTEDIDNRFRLVLLAAKRARQIESGAKPLVEEENDKPTVLALREIAAGEIGIEVMDEVSGQVHVGEEGVSDAEVQAEISS